MDREIVFAILFAVVGTVVASAYYFGGGTPAQSATYAPEDIRFPIQQAEEKAKAKAATKRKHVIAPPADTYASDDYTESAADESDIEQPSAEEPELE